MEPAHQPAAHHPEPAAVPAPVVPQVVAHRGASHDEPEHTRAAYLAAIAQGADAFECDVRMTADGHLVCVHDRRVERTSDGSGAVSALRLAQLEALDWGSWKGLAAGPGDPRERSGLLTLRGLLALAGEAAAAGRPVRLAIETKHPTRHGRRVEQALARLLGEAGLDGPGTPVRMMSFSAAAVARMGRLAPHVPRVLLVDRPGIWPLRGPTAAGVAVGLSIDLVRRNPGLVRHHHERGRAVDVWTVDDPDDVRRCLDAGVRSIITNRPGAVRRLLDGRVTTTG